MIRAAIRPALLLALWVLLWPAGALPAQEASEGSPPGQDAPRMLRRDRRMRDPGVRQLLLRLAEMPPAEQQQALEDDPAFQQMPPEVKQRIRARLEELNHLPPEERRKRLEEFRLVGGRHRAHDLFLRVAPLGREEQEQLLAEDELFQRMPPHAQRRFRRHLERFNNLPPDARGREIERLRRFAELPDERQEKLRRRAKRFAEMSPEQREQAREVFHAWRRLPPERRQLMIERLQRLHRASAEERRALSQDENFLAPLNQDERGLLRRLWELRQRMPPPPSDRP